MAYIAFRKSVWLIPAVLLAAEGLLALGCSGSAAPTSTATTFTPLTADTTRETDPAPSPDGKWIAFTSDRGGHGATQIYLMPAGGGEAKQLTHEPDSVRAGTPSWAPDGKSLLFVSTRGKRYNIYNVNIETGATKQLTHAPGSHRFGCYSSDGRQIAFYSNRVRPGDLYGFNIFVMGASGENEDNFARQITDSKGSPGHPTWSADMKWVAFVEKDYDSTRQQTIEGSILFTKYHLFKVSSRGGKEIQLTSGAVDGQAVEDTWPSWSPDGKWIAFGRQLGTKRDVWILDVATNRTFPLTTAGNCIKPTWAWDSKSIYYSSIAADSTRNEDIWVARDLALKVPPPPKPAAGKAGAARRGPRAPVRASTPRTTRK
ncbi:MAG TPA: DPP IV N-terminal domain-containing protein [Candidatus Polarisedimenticolia bacterium]|nr:DPP IV N-terminal domain-containing protein [Candidatus Polarisedimenticolia bacterium]